MSGELERYRFYGVAQQHAREADAVHRRAELASARLLDIGELTQEAVLEHLLTSMTVESATRVAPSGANEYRMIAVAGATAMAQEIIRFGGRR